MIYISRVTLRHCIMQTFQEVRYEDSASVFLIKEGHQHSDFAYIHLYLKLSDQLNEIIFGNVLVPVFVEEV